MVLPFLEVSEPLLAFLKTWGLSMECFFLKREEAIEFRELKNLFFVADFPLSVKEPLLRLDR